jgi:hypothetical protein
MVELELTMRYIPVDMAIGRTIVTKKVNKMNAFDNSKTPFYF